MKNLVRNKILVPVSYSGSLRLFVVLFYLSTKIKVFQNKRIKQFCDFDKLSIKLMAF